MKSPLVYLTVTKLKNQLIAVVKSPAKLVYAVILVALFALTAFSGSSYDVEELRSPVELIAILTLFYTMMFLMVFAAGSSSSNSPMFTLSDVTLRFMIHGILYKNLLMHQAFHKQTILPGISCKDQLKKLTRICFIFIRSTPVTVAISVY